ncbi:MAG: hypothetical protein FWE18_03725 [Alphaproteobacteria bacterium]|nr:hypothetical protein [Alphaproteobacteria bacterium]
MAYDLKDVSSWKKSEDTTESKKYSATFFVKDIFNPTDGTTRKEVPLIEFKSSYNKHASQIFEVDFVRFTNFKELQPDIARFYAKKYDGSLEDASKDVRDVLIYHGFYRLDICKNYSREFFSSILAEIKNELIIEIMDYLKSKGCFSDKAKKVKAEPVDVPIKNNINPDIEEKFSKMQEAIDKKDAQIDRLLNMIEAKKAKELEKEVE